MFNFFMLIDIFLCLPNPISSISPIIFSTRVLKCEVSQERNFRVITELPVLPSLENGGKKQLFQRTPVDMVHQGKGFP
jgi:hypothetical protein